MRVFTPEQRKYRALKERERRARLKAEDPQYFKKFYKYDKEGRRKYYLENRDTILEKAKERAQTTESKTRKKEYNREYREENWDWIKKDQQEYVKRKEKASPEFKLKRNLRDRTRKFLRVKGLPKKNSFTQAIGCSPQTLKKHIESQFKPGMSWDNYGSGKDKWNLDHIKPLNTAKDINEIYELCHYTNLQPMWSIENSSKGDKYES